MMRARLACLVAVCAAACAGCGYPSLRVAGDGGPEPDVMDAVADVPADEGDAGVDAEECPAEQARCGAACVDTQTSVEHCGGCGAACTAPANGSARCAAGACEAQCDPGYDLVDGACDPRPPRQVAPLTTATVTSRVPTFHWEPQVGVPSARLEICVDSACNTVLQTVDAEGTMETPARAASARDTLPVGLLFWRVRGKSGDAVGRTPSAVWQFRTRMISARVDSSFGQETDLNGDGVGDVVVGSQSGLVQVFAGRAGMPLSSVPASSLTAPAGADRFGEAVTCAGDVNGDGIVDLVVGAPGTHRAFVYHGARGRLANTPAVTLIGPDASGFGAAVAGAGDVNRDGYADVLIGAPTRSRAYLFRGGPDGITMGRSVEITSPAGAHFGSAVGGGDVNGDGYADALIATSAALHVYHGGPMGPGAMPNSSVSAGLGSAFPRCATSVGDLNADGFGDVAFCQIHFNRIGGSIDYSIGVFLGGSRGLSSTPLRTFTGGGSATAAGLHDFNRDGFGDLVVVPRGTAGMQIYRGDGTGLSMTAFTIAPPAGVPDFNVVSGMSDFDSDNAFDLAISSSSGNSVHLYYSTGFGFASTPTVNLRAPVSTMGFGVSLAWAPLAPRWRWLALLGG